MFWFCQTRLAKLKFWEIREDGVSWWDRVLSSRRSHPVCQQVYGTHWCLCTYAPINNYGFFESAATINICSKCHKAMILNQEQVQLTVLAIGSKCLQFQSHKKFIFSFNNPKSLSFSFKFSLILTLGFLNFQLGLLIDEFKQWKRIHVNCCLESKR